MGAEFDYRDETLRCRVCGCIHFIRYSWSDERKNEETAAWNKYHNTNCIAPRERWEDDNKRFGMGISF